MARTRKTEEVEFTRGQFAHASLKVFLEKGIFGASMEEISRAAGYSGTAIYKYFRTKDEIFHAAAELISKDFLEILDEPVPANLDFRAFLTWKMTRALAKADKDRYVFIGFMTRIATGPWLEEAHASIRDMHMVFMHRVEDYMRRGIAEGVLAPRDPSIYASALDGLTHAFIERWLFEGASYPLTDQVETIIDLFLHGAGGREGAGS